jgi:hypothetical protein
MRIKTKYCFLLFASIFVVSCSVRHTKKNDPIFADIEKTKSEIGNLIQAENINISGKEITTGKDSTSELEIVVTNGQNVPATENERIFLSKSLAKSIKNNLTHTDQFETYNVKFITRTKGESMTVDKYIIDTYKIKEL